MISLLTNRWFWMAALAVGLFFSTALLAKSVQNHRETKAAYKALIQNFEQTQAAFEQRDLELRTITAQLTERRRVVYVARDDCADSRVSDDIIVSLRGQTATNP